MKSHNYYVYIMGSSAGTLYVGITNNLERRVFEHKNEIVEGFSQKYKCKKLLYWEHFTNVENAIDREKQLKGWKRYKKIRLIRESNPSWKDLSCEWFK